MCNKSCVTFFFSLDYTRNFDGTEVGGVCGPNLSLTAITHDHLQCGQLPWTPPTAL